MRHTTLKLIKHKFKSIYTFGKSRTFGKVLNLDDLGFVAIFPEHDLCLIEEYYNSRKTKFANAVAISRKLKLNEFLKAENDGFKFKEVLDDFLILEK